VGGYYCPTSGEIAGRTQPADHLYYLTSFGGGSDTQAMACGGTADGHWLYLADSWRFGCGTHVQITNPATGDFCVAQVADVGPNICVEEAAHRPVIDASPLVAEYLFHVSGAGWSDRRSIAAVVVPRSTALGCHPRPTCTPHCSGNDVVASDCASTACPSAHTCSSAGGMAPHCVSLTCVASASTVPAAHDVCVSGEIASCSASGVLGAAMHCPAGESCESSGSSAACRPTADDAGSIGSDAASDAHSTGGDAEPDGARDGASENHDGAADGAGDARAADGEPADDAGRGSAHGASCSVTTPGSRPAGTMVGLIALALLLGRRRRTR
jgi:MYXO-CTERM domain-containing protein